MMPICILTLFGLPGVVSFAMGPPLSACTDMFPGGHGFDAQNANGSLPPFFITVNSTTYRPGDIIQVFLNSTAPWFFEGVFIQARRAKCNSPMRDSPVGTFKTMPNEDFVNPIDCSGITASALAHYSHNHISNRIIYWIAPSQSVGHIYLRGTFARNKRIFWTNVFSSFIRDSSIPDQTPEKCEVQSRMTGGSRSTLMITFPLLFLTVLFSFI
ncbi:hypothetical protein CHS0354_026754 [Potamilus streckersoni]|uniref:Reelin domain-containing protein n=1 Tax=Potamilus streckersoni TaxID=2493646 RepID=A0AAE0SAJ4_9BIVA|nr:hypothetical protein CHS0354_026754 [Potamilus streckersoni]